MQLLTKEVKKVANTRIIYMDPNNLVDFETREVISEQLKGYQGNQLRNQDLILYFLDDYHKESWEEIQSILESIKGQPSYLLIVSMKPLHNRLLSFLSLPVNGILSLDFFKKNLSIVFRCLLEKGICIEPSLHKEMIAEIERRKNKDAAIKKLVLNKEKVQSFLSEKEQKVLQLMLDGNNNIAIAETLFFAQSTINSIISRLLKKLEANDRTDAVIKTIRHGWVDAVR